MQVLILSFLVLLPRALLGFLVVHTLWRSVHPGDLIIKAALAGPLGLGVSSLIAFFWIWAGLELRLYALLETAAALLLAAAAFWRERTALARAIRGIRLRPSWQGLFWAGLLILAFLLFSAEFWIQVLPTPHGWWDAWWNWNVVARFIYRGGEHWTGTFLRTDDHPDYPLLHSISNAISWALLPRETTRGPMALAFYDAISMTGLIFGLVSRLRGSAQGVLAASLMIIQPFVAFYAMMLFADLPLAVYFLASLGLMVLFLREQRTALPILAGLAAGLAGWTKNEGLPFIITCTIAWIWLARSAPAGKSALRGFLAGLALPLLTIICFKLFLAPPNDLLNGKQDVLGLLLQPQRYAFVLRRSFQVLWSLHDGSLAVIMLLVAYALIVGRSPTPASGTALLTGILLAQAAVYFVVFLTSPHDLEWHVRSSIGRLYLHIFPGLILAAFLVLKSPPELSSISLQSEYAAHH